MAAFEVMYQLGVEAELGTPIGYGCIAIKNELHYRGFDYGQDESPRIGTNADRAIKAFQGNQLLRIDGQAGPITCRALFLARSRAWETEAGIPWPYVQQVKSLESSSDPGAVGVIDPDDLGLTQINVRIHSKITREQAFDPDFALGYLARGLKSAVQTIGDWDGAVASWNVGNFYANAWVAAGKPKTGKKDGKIDWFARASHYVELVKAQPL